MRTLYESILDTDLSITKQADTKALSLELFENGVYWACERTGTRFAAARENEIMSFEDGKLCFFNDQAHVCSEVVIWYDKAKNFLKKLNVQIIEAPRITIVRSGDDMSMFGQMRTRILRLYDPKSNDIKNMHVEAGRCSDYTIIKNSDIKFRRGDAEFEDSRGGEVESANHTFIKIEGYDKITFHNSVLDMNSIAMNGEGIDFKNCKGGLKSIEVYDPCLFDGDCGRDLFTLFDDKYEFYCWRDKGGQRQELRKTSSLRKTLAYFGSKQYYCPFSTPFKIDGSLKSVCNLSGFNNIYALSYRDNNYCIEFTPDIDAAQRWRSIERFKYMTNDHQMTTLQRTKDGFYCVIFYDKQ